MQILLCRFRRPCLGTGTGRWRGVVKVGWPVRGGGVAGPHLSCWWRRWLKRGAGRTVHAGPCADHAGINWGVFRTMGKVSFPHQSAILAHMGASAVHWRELPLGHCCTGSTLLGFNTTQTQHFLCLTFNTPHNKQSFIQQ